MLKYFFVIPLQIDLQFELTQQLSNESSGNKILVKTNTIENIEEPCELHPYFFYESINPLLFWAILTGNQSGIV